jgi:uncharacterized protein YqhQ
LLLLQFSVFGSKEKKKEEAKRNKEGKSKFQKLVGAVLSIYFAVAVLTIRTCRLSGFHNWFRTHIGQQFKLVLWALIQLYYLLFNCVPLT